jgi:hypothetical protein
VNQIRLAAALLVGGSIVLAASTLAPAPGDARAAAGATGKAASGRADTAGVARGRYLVTIMACNDCHTPGTFYGGPDPERFLAGSEMGWAGPWGVVYAANLTPDPETGLGKWSAEAIARAIRTGNRPDGRQLAAAMPWLDYSNLTDADALAIARYLGTLQPVKHAVPRPLAPGADAKGPLLAFPPPSAWDAPRGAAAGEK